MSLVQVQLRPCQFPKFSQKQKEGECLSAIVRMGIFTFMAQKRESRDWYDKTIRAIAQRKDLPFYDRMNYCYQTLLNFMLKYDTRKIGRDRSWLIAWSTFVRENTLYAIASNFEGDFPTLYWSVMLLEARHYVVDSYFLFLERKREQHAKFYEPRRDPDEAWCYPVSARPC